MQDGAFSPRRTLATSARFFAMNATDSTAKVLSLQGPRAWPTLEAANSTTQRDRLEPHVVDPSWAACLAGNGTPDVMKSRSPRHEQCQEQAQWYRLVSPKRPNLWQPGPNQAHRMVLQNVPSGTALHPYDRHVPSHRPHPICKKKKNSSKNTFIQKHFRPKQLTISSTTISSKNGFIQIFLSP